MAFAVGAEAMASDRPAVGARMGQAGGQFCGGSFGWWDSSDFDRGDE